PSTERVYHEVERKFSLRNVIMVHPSDEEYYQESLSACPVARGHGGVVNHPLLSVPAIDLDGMSQEEAVKALLESYFAPGSRKVREIMKKITPLDPVELTPEIALFHTHTDGIDNPVVLLGRSLEGLELPGMKVKVSAVFMLVSPNDQTAAHLKTLASIAQMARDCF
ncbi:MAG TPA: PTS sugar transporter subunit IIA, partial [Candidatus Omnitrophota bacterium]|nr:PTS sugar transporter subunit IIA [Candidatus Omnitrophota bacterium]